MLREIVILLEDDIEDTRALSHGLSEQGYKVVCVQTIAEVEEAARNGVQKFICDIRLGSSLDRSGLRAIKKIRNHNPSAFIVICSGIATAWAEFAMELSADAVVCKGRGEMRATVFEIVTHFLRHDRNGQIFRFLAAWVALPLVFSGASSWISWHAGLSLPFLSRLGSVSFPLALGVLFVLTLSVAEGDADPVVSRHRIFERFRSLRLSLVIAVASGIVYDILKNLFDWRTL